MSPPPADKADDNTPDFYSSQQDALPRSESPTPSDNSPQPSLVSQSGNLVSKSTNLSQNKGEAMYPASHLATVPKTLQRVSPYADFTGMPLSSNDSHSFTGAYSDAAPNQPSLGTEPHLTDNPTTADPAAASTSREGSSNDRKDMSRSRSGQPPTSIDNGHGVAKGVAAPPISSSKSSGMFYSEEVVPIRPTRPTSLVHEPIPEPVPPEPAPSDPVLSYPSPVPPARTQRVPVSVSMPRQFPPAHSLSAPEPFRPAHTQRAPVSLLMPQRPQDTSRCALSAPEPFRLARTPPTRPSTPQDSLPAESYPGRQKKSILRIICPCLG